MTTLVVCFILSLIALWLLVMAALWKKHTLEQDTRVINPLIKKIIQRIRRSWFFLLRGAATVRDLLAVGTAKAFFVLFPKAQKAFEQKDELTGLHQGPSSYFLMSISEGKESSEKEVPKIRRKRKNV